MSKRKREESKEAEKAKKQEEVGKGEMFLPSTPPQLGLNSEKATNSLPPLSPITSAHAAGKTWADLVRLRSGNQIENPSQKTIAQILQEKNHEASMAELIQQTREMEVGIKKRSKVNAKR